MKGVTILIDEKKKTKIVQANISNIVKNSTEFEDLIFSLIEEYRNGGSAIRKQRLKKS